MANLHRSTNSSTILTCNMFLEHNPLRCSRPPLKSALQTEQCKLLPLSLLLGFPSGKGSFELHGWLSPLPHHHSPKPLFEDDKKMSDVTEDFQTHHMLAPLAVTGSALLPPWPVHTAPHQPLSVFGYELINKLPQVNQVGTSVRTKHLTQVLGNSVIKIGQLTALLAVTTGYAGQRSIQMGTWPLLSWQLENLAC